jgi:hypothetical protein
MRIGRVDRRWSAWMLAGPLPDVRPGVRPGVRDPFRVVVMN